MNNESRLQTYCETDLHDPTFESKLDNHKGFIAYRNGLYDIENDILLDICYDHYLSKTLPFDYVKGDEREKQQIKSSD